MSYLQFNLFKQKAVRKKAAHKALGDWVPYFRATLLMTIMLVNRPMPAFSYETIDDFQGGKIHGTVQWMGETIPERYTHTVQKNTDFCGKTFADDALVVNSKNRGMENVLVYLSDIEKGKAPERTYVNIIKKCRFAPRVMGVVKDTLIGFRHDDFITHNIHIFRLDNNATVLNFGLPIHRWQQTITRMHRKTGVYRMQCDIHDHMNGLIVALDHGYFSITNADGEFEINDIPPGTYHLVAFQGGYQIQNEEERGKKGFRPIFESPHQQTGEVEVEINETTVTNFEFNKNH